MKTLSIRSAAVNFGLGLVCAPLVLAQAPPAPPPPPPVPANLFAKPGGPFAVGTREYLWVDERRGESYTKDPSDKRHLMVQIWYPARSNGGGELAPYIRNPEEFGKSPEFQRVSHVKTNAVTDAPLAESERRYPVLVYHPGGGWTRFSATFTTEFLASHGYVVLSVDHTGFNKSTQFPDGYKFAPDTLQMPSQTGNLRVDALASWEWLERDVFPVWVADAKLALDKLEEFDRGPGPFRGRLDLERIGMLGWSFGGATAVDLAVQDPRVKAAVDHDGQLFGASRVKGSSRPVMLLHNDRDPAEGAPAEQLPIWKELVAMVRGWDSTFLSRTTGDWYELTIQRTNHAHFSDLLFFYPRDTTLLAPSRAHEIINEYTLAFFDKYLRGRDQPLLAGSSPRFPEVRFRAK